MKLGPDRLKVWLEWAGARLMAMPGGKIKPAAERVAWPEFSQDVWEVIDFRGSMPLRAAAPSAHEIPMVDLILTLPNVCEWDKTRRILHVRSLIHPINNRYLYQWTRIGELLQLDRKTVRAIHARGLREAASKANPEIVCRITAFFNEESVGA